MLSAVLPPTLEAARDFRTRFGAAFTRLGIDAQSTDAALLVGSEMIVNIVQHAKPTANGITVDLSVRGSRWHMSIRDDGGPFSDIAEKVAEAGDTNSSALREGGMGLMLLDTHFPGWIYVPRHADGEDNTLSYSGGLPSWNRHRKRVLLVDDEQIQLDIAAEFLNATFEVASASSVDEAQRLLEEYLPDVIVCDIRMPGTNGLEFRRRLRHSPKTSAVPFVFLTGVERDDIEAEADALAIDDFLTKPVDRARLLAVINRVITRVSDLRESFGNMLERGITSALVDGAPERLGDWTCAMRSEAASAGGGDMIYHHKSADRDILVLADVMGHGLPAKFYAHVLNGFLTGYLTAAPRNSAPSELLGNLSDVFARERILRKTIATAIAIAVEPDGNLTIASAGHAPPVLLRHGEKQDIRVSGPLLGLASGLTYDAITLETQPDDRIVFWTDGCVEIGDPTAHQDMEDCFLSVLLETASATSADTLEQIFTHIFAQSPNGLADDATVVILSKDDK